MLPLRQSRWSQRLQSWSGGRSSCQNLQPLPLAMCQNLQPLPLAIPPPGLQRMWRFWGCAVPLLWDIIKIPSPLLSWMVLSWLQLLGPFIRRVPMKRANRAKRANNTKKQQSSGNYQVRGRLVINLPVFLAMMSMMILSILIWVMRGREFKAILAMATDSSCHLMTLPAILTTYPPKLRSVNILFSSRGWWVRQSIRRRLAS